MPGNAAGDPAGSSVAPVGRPRQVLVAGMLVPAAWLLIGCSAGRIWSPRRRPPNRCSVRCTARVPRCRRTAGCSRPNSTSPRCSGPSWTRCPRRACTLQRVAGAVHRLLGVSGPRGRPERSGGVGLHRPDGAQRRRRCPFAVTADGVRYAGQCGDGGLHPDRHPAALLAGRQQPLGSQNPDECPASPPSHPRPRRRSRDGRRRGPDRRHHRDRRAQAGVATHRGAANGRSG